MINAQPFQEISGCYDTLNDVISFGLHRRWKERLVDEVVELCQTPPQCAVDVAAGTLHVTELLAKKLPPNATVVGFDPCKEMIEEGIEKGRGLGCPTLGFAEDLPFKSRSVDAITSAFGVRNYSDRKASFREWHRVLRMGGAVGVLEIHPIPRGWYDPFVRFYWDQLVPRMGRVVGKQSAYTYLRDTAKAFVSSRELSEEICSVGFSEFSRHPLMARGMVTLSLFTKTENA